MKKYKNDSDTDHLIRYGLMIICSLLLSGCNSTGFDIFYSDIFRIKIEDVSSLSADQLQQLPLVQIHKSAAGLNYTSKGQVKGLSCKTMGLNYLTKVWFWNPALNDLNGKTPQEAAMTQMKIKAIKAGGNGVISASCSHNETLDQANNCYESWICTGEAVHLE